jgi:hypothetical protein
VSRRWILVHQMGSVYYRPEREGRRVEQEGLRPET